MNNALKYSKKVCTKCGGKCCKAARLCRSCYVQELVKRNFGGKGMSRSEMAARSQAKKRSVKCEHCRKPFVTSQPKRRFCSRKCFRLFRYPFLKDKNNEYRRRRMYGLTPTQVKEMWEKQNGRCAICFKELPFKKIHVDHCHEKLLARGLLCRTCNSGLGMFKDNIAMLKQAIRYLIPWEKI